MWVKLIRVPSTGLKLIFCITSPSIKCTFSASSDLKFTKFIMVAARQSMPFDQLCCQQDVIKFLPLEEPYLITLIIFISNISFPSQVQLVL